MKRERTPDPAQPQPAPTSAEWVDFAAQVADIKERLLENSSVWLFAHDLERALAACAGESIVKDRRAAS